MKTVTYDVEYYSKSLGKWNIWDLNNKTISAARKCIKRTLAQYIVADRKYRIVKETTTREVIK